MVIAAGTPLLHITKRGDGSNAVPSLFVFARLKPFLRVLCACALQRLGV